MIAHHMERKADLTIGAISDGSKVFTRIRCDRDRSGMANCWISGEACRTQDDPGDPEGILASMGIYVFNIETLVRRLIDDTRSDSSHDFGKDIIPSMIGKDQIFAFDFAKGDQGGTGYWRDVGTLDAYFDANMDLISVTPQLNLYDPQWPILTYQAPYPPAKTVHAEKERMGTVVNSVISNGCIISGGTVKRSILSPRAHVHSFAEVEDSILFEGVDIGRHAKIRKAIIDKEVHIPQETEIGYNLEEDAKRFTVTPSGLWSYPSGSSFEGKRGPPDVEQWANITEGFSDPRDH